MENLTEENRKKKSNNFSDEELMNAFIEKNKKTETDLNFESLAMKNKMIIFKYKLEELNRFVNKMTEI